MRLSLRRLRAGVLVCLFIAMLLSIGRAEEPATDEPILAVAVVNERLKANPVWLGELNVGKVNKVELACLNSTLGSLEIQGLETTCGCIRLEEFSGTVRKNETFLLRGAVFPQQQASRFEQHVLLHTKEDGADPIRLVVSGELVSEITIVPTVVVFDSSGGPTEMTFKSRTREIAGIETLRGVVKIDKISHDAKFQCTLQLSPLLSHGQSIEVFRVTHRDPAKAELTETIDISVAVQSSTAVRLIPNQYALIPDESTIRFIAISTDGREQLDISPKNLSFEYSDGRIESIDNPGHDKILISRKSPTVCRILLRELGDLRGVEAVVIKSGEQAFRLPLLQPNDNS